MKFLLICNFLKNVYNINSGDFMSQLHDFNIELINKYNNLENKEDLSFPLLVSSNESYLEGLKDNKKIFYIGQETNCWLNSNDINMVPDVNILENAYYNFLTKRCATNRDFWTFIRACLEIEKEELSKNIIWSNLFVSGKRTEIGAPNYTDDLVNMSIENLTFLYEYFKPNGVVIVGGPCNPYYKLTIEFLKQIKCNLIDSWPTLNNPLLIDEEKNIFWTYHPNYQNKKNIKTKIIGEIKNKLL